MKAIILVITLFFNIQSFAVESKKNAQESTHTVQKSILVTGASSGIGRNIAERLAKEGYFVYAGARKKADLDALSAMKNIQGIRLDVTIQDDIDKAVDIVRKEGRGLYGLVNNAGVALFGPLIEVSEKDMQFLMDVNLFGPYRVTKAFAPLIIESKGRITTTGSISGIISGSMFGPYSMSKHAVEAFTDSLALELKKFDVQVSVIEPGNYNSQVIKNMRRRMENVHSVLESSHYKEEFQRILDMPTDRSAHKNPDDVSTAVLHALFSDKPKARYMVVPNQREAEFTIQRALKKVIELNRQHAFSYTREELSSMLEKASK